MTFSRASPMSLDIWNGKWINQFLSKDRQMAKKKTKKKVSKRPAGQNEFIDNLEDLHDPDAPTTGVDMIDGRVAAVHMCVQDLNGLDLDDMEDRFRQKLINTVGTIEKFATSLQKAIDVSNKNKAKKAALKQRLLDKAASIEV